MTKASAAFVDLLSGEGELQASLARMGLAGSDVQPLVKKLTGGVSSNIFLATVNGRSFCIKQALPKLRVEKDWRVPVDRVFAEIDWLQVAGAVVPGHVPRVLGVDRAIGAFAMEYLSPADHANWKDQLLGGAIDTAVAARVGDVLGRIHAATAANAGHAMRFANDANFFALRLEPYLLESARQNPARARELVRLVDATLNNARVVVHGDVSPKNILLGPGGPVLLDAECAWWGDPAFDLAFVLNHLMLKSAHRPDFARLLDDAFARLLDAYAAHIGWEPRESVLRRTAGLLPGMMLARIDGKSPVEYLAATPRVQVRDFALGMLGKELESPLALLGCWQAFRPGA